MKMYSHTLLHPNKPQKGSRYNQTNKKATNTNKHIPTKGKQKITWQRPRSKQTCMDLKDKAWKRANKT